MENESIVESLGELKYELVNGTQLYVLKDFDNVKVVFEKAIENLHINEILETPEQIKNYKKRRTSINNAKKKIARVRLDLTECVMGTFQEQCKELEKMLDDASKQMGEKLKTNVTEVPTFKIEITSGSKAVIEKIRKSLLKNTDVIYKTNYQIEGDN